jgi:hypothetical protein
MYYDTAANKLKICYDGSTWSDVGGGGAGDYVARTGDTMSGNLTMDDTTSESPQILFEGSGTEEARLYYYSDHFFWISSDKNIELYGGGNRMQFYLYGATTHSSNEGWFRYLLPSSDDNSYFEIWDSGSHNLFQVKGDRTIWFNGQQFGGMSGSTYYDKPSTSTSLGESSGVLGGMMAWANNITRAAVEVYNDVTSGVMELLDDTNSQSIGGTKTFTSDLKMNNGSDRATLSSAGLLTLRSSGANPTTRYGTLYHDNNNFHVRSYYGKLRMIIDSGGGYNWDVAKSDGTVLAYCDINGNFDCENDFYNAGTAGINDTIPSTFSHIYVLGGIIYDWD